MTKRAALADEERNLLKVVEKIRISSDMDLKTYMRDKNRTERIQGFIRGYTVVEEHEREDGSIDVILELPLTSQKGLSHYVSE